MVGVGAFIVVEAMSRMGGDPEVASRRWWWSA